MDRIILATGTKQNMPDNISDLQDNIHSEFKRLYQKLFKEFGVVAEYRNGSIPATETALKVEVGDGNNELFINPGSAITPSGHQLTVYAPGKTATLTTNGSYTLYIKPRAIYTEYTEKVAGIQYGEDSARTPIRSEDYYDFTTVDPGISGLALAEFTVSGTTMDVTTDLRDTNLLRWNEALYYEDDVVRTDRDTTVSGTLTMNGLVINDSLEAHSVTFAGQLDSDYDISLSGLVFAHDNRHSHSTDTFNPSDVEASASALNLCLNHGILNYSDGEGDRWITTTKVPSEPNQVSSISGHLYQVQQDDTITRSLQDKVTSHRIKEFDLTKATTANTQLRRLRNYQLAWRSANTGSVSGYQLWTDQTSLYGPDQLSISGFAQTIVDAGWATAEACGLYMLEDSIEDIITHVDTQADSKVTEASNARSDLDALAADITANSELLQEQPDLAKPRYRVKITWGQPTLIDNEKIEYYNVKICKLVGSATEVDPSTKEPATFLDDEVSTVLRTDNFTTEKAQKKKVLQHEGTTITVSSVTASTKYLVVDTVISSIARVGDYVQVDRSGTLIQKNIVASVVDSTTLELVMSVSDIQTGDTIIIYRTELQSTTSSTTQWIDVNIDQVYIVFVQAISELGVAGPWSNGFKIVTNTLVDNVSGNTLRNLKDAEAVVLRTAKVAELTALKTEVSKAVSDVSQQIASLPTVDNIRSLNDAITSL